MKTEQGYEPRFSATEARLVTSWLAKTDINDVYLHISDEEGQSPTDDELENFFMVLKKIQRMVTSRVY